ncbi:MAG TPA: hypothetical protein VKB39_03645, partial [Candidatus Baltobacteraceae bacterium]|nr:hypothetical protein [Candidatus Baltobacteraceae bacterium]
MAYEQQFIEYLMQHPPSERPKGMVPLYPKPTVYTKHTLVPTDAVGDKVGQLLESDPVLRTLEIKHGFRNSDTSQMRSIWSANHVDVPDSLIDVIDPPSFETLETMIKGVDSAFSQQ